MKIIRKFEFTEEEVQALSTVKRMLQEVTDDDFDLIFKESNSPIDGEEFYETLFSLWRFAESNTVKDDTPSLNPF